MVGRAQWFAGGQRVEDAMRFKCGVQEVSRNRAHVLCREADHVYITGSRAEIVMRQNAVEGQ